MLSNLRVVRAAALQDYHFEIARIHQRNAHPTLLSVGPYLKEYVLYHAWKPGHVDLSKSQAASYQQHRGLRGQMADLGWLEDEALDVNQLTSKIFSTFQAIQNADELNRFLTWVQVRRPKTVVEIGTAGGGMLYGLCQTSDPAATLISIDAAPSPEEVFSSFAGALQEVRTIQGDSRSYETREKLKKILKGRPIDLLFIDGDHSYGAVKSDFSMYAPLVAAGGHVALHDVNVDPEKFSGIEVALFWRELQAEFETEAIVGPSVASPRRWDEIPWGIGIVPR